MVHLKKEDLKRNYVIQRYIHVCTMNIVIVHWYTNNVRHTMYTGKRTLYVGIRTMYAICI